MRYVKGHGPETRRRIVENASFALRQRGADGISLVDLMRRAVSRVAASTFISNRAKPWWSRRLPLQWIKESPSGWSS